ncbi:iron-regulated protein [Herbaspirillum sp. meg3]|uniref:PepSY-associated TM helix domain-containing protein n=1 Tax=Herbaspirillum sp. meg3 TaxID=2025949 RepID=UPI000B991213|nr:PepSY-associated TM helix domain-containing protein [Herbaspirillum sp. meg3]ASU38880.1 iron-regulated protein [Herbaspirillum sp. meg3]
MRIWHPTRQTFVLLHRWTGLAIAFFLVVASLTGTLLAFEDELEVWLAPQLHVALPASRKATDAMLDPYTLRERVEQALGPKVRISQLMLRPEPGRTLAFTPDPAIDPATQRPYQLGYNQILVNPYTGAIQGVRDLNKISIRPENLMPFLFRIHHSMALPRIPGALLMGLVSVLWTIDCFVGAYLTWPRGRPFFTKWKPAWLVKWQAGFYRVNLDLHRALGLWCWLMLLLFAWSSVMFNLREQVFEPVMATVLPFDNSWRGQPALREPLAQMPMTWPQAHAAARKAMQQFASEHAMQIDAEERLSFDRRRGLFAYMVHSSLDLRPHVGNTGVLIDARTGELRGHWLPTGDVSGNTFSNWIGALHMGHVFGLPWRIFITFIGLFITVVSVTGVIVWWKKRRAKSTVRR